jgi:hypothetical protein
MEDANRLRNGKLLASAERLNDVLGEILIKPVFLKGLAFVIEDEALASWREVSDIDVLLEPSSLKDAARHLLANGYRLGEDVAGYEHGLHHHYPALYDETGTMVELHGRLTPLAGDDPLSWQEMQNATREGDHGLIIPSPEHRMVHLVIHAQSSNWGYALRRICLRDLLDVRELVRRHEIDWSAIQDIFGRTGAKRQLHGFLCALEDPFGIPFPYSKFERRAALPWATSANASLAKYPPAWVTTARMLGAYGAAFLRDPARLRLVWRTFVDPSRRAYLKSITRDRLGLGK